MIMYDGRIFNLVNKLRKRYGTNNPYEIANMCDIIVSYEDMGNVKGMYTVVERHPFIILNESLDEDMERLVMFHELGHHFIHREFKVAAFREYSLYDMSSKFEIEANTFAANFLISDEDLVCAAYDGYTSEQIARSMRVPHELVLIKLKNLTERGYDFKICFEPESDFLAD